MSVLGATVEVLTAEVRVLMVGSRQVTLSVFRQLDEAPPGKIEPFGRVNADEADGAIRVVGSLDGVLVKSSAYQLLRDCHRYGQRCIEHRDIDCAAERGDFGQPWKGHEWFAYSPSSDLWLAWTRLPLIVLAGLR